MRQSKPNPITKGPTGAVACGMKHGSVARELRGWGYVCECGESTHKSHYGSTMTRKKAKDAYHQHRLKNHSRQA